MPQGLKHSPHVFNQVLKLDLEDLRLDSTLIQYEDDLLVCSTTLEQCHKDSTPQPQTVGQMMTFLGMTGFSADW